MAKIDKNAARRERAAKALARAEKIVGGIALQEEKEKARRRAALAETFDDWLADLSDEMLVSIFSGMEAKATARNRKLIQDHPSRPTQMTEDPAAEA